MRFRLLLGISIETVVLRDKKRGCSNTAHADGCVISQAAYTAQNSELLKSRFGLFHVSSEFIATMV